MDPARNPWTVLSREARYQTPWIEVVHHEVLTPAGRPGIYGTVRFRNHAVGVVPVDGQGWTWLVGQYRFPLDRYSWEIPEGGAPVGTDPFLSARRELKEETGLEAAHWLPLLEMDLSNSVSNEQGTIWLAWGLSQGAAMPEETEDLTIRHLPLAEAVAMAMDGRIRDSLSLAALIKLKLLAVQGDLPADLLAPARRGLGL